MRANAGRGLSIRLKLAGRLNPLLPFSREGIAPTQAFT
nr:MAG TPA: hypothetical protein [Caudoviricetes sp.]